MTATQPTAVFMAFGTKGDVHPVAAIAAAFAEDQSQYRVAFVTHAAHEVVCPCMLDQFYWAERMFWLGVAPEPLKRNQLLPDDDDHTGTKVAANILARAVDYALSPEVKARASAVAEILSFEDGVAEAVKILKEELSSGGEK